VLRSNDPTNSVKALKEDKVVKLGLGTKYRQIDSTAMDIIRTANYILGPQLIKLNVAVSYVLRI